MEQKSQSATSIALTPSVHSVVTKLGQARVTSWQVVQALLELHGEYGRNRGQEVRQGTGPANGTTQLVMHWIAKVSELFDPGQVHELHGRLLVLGLCQLPQEQPLAQYLGGTGFLAAVQDELREDFRSLLTAAAAGPEEQYRGDFLRIVQNRGKLDDSYPMHRTQGFVVIAERARRLADLAALTQRQSYNRCYTARYVLPQRQTLAHGLQRFVFDLMALESGKGTIEGDLLPDPVASAETWKPLLKDRVKQALSRQPRPSQQATPAPAEIGRLRPVFDALGDEAVLDTGLRLILLFEFRGGVNPNVQGSESVLDRDGIALLSRLPERIGIVVSGFAAGAKAAIASLPNVFSLQLPLDADLTRGLPPSNDVPGGPDLLGLGTEVRAIAEAIALKDMTPPLVVGVIGGWGAGKSFVLHLLEERLQEIRCERVPDPNGPEQSGEFPFIGHPYVIRFDAWTYAKGNLWASLMQTIFVELERQIGLEQALSEKVGISLRDETEIWRVLSMLDDDERDRLTRSDLGVKALEVVRNFDKGNITNLSLWETLSALRKTERDQLAKEEQELAALRQRRDDARHTLEEEVDKVIASDSRAIAWRALGTHYRGWAIAQLRKWVEAEAKKRGATVPETTDVKNAVTWYKQLLLGGLSAPLAFLTFVAIAVGLYFLNKDVLQWLDTKVASLLTVVGTGLATFLKGFAWLEKRRTEFGQFVAKTAESLPSREKRIDDALAAARRAGAQAPAGQPALATAAADVASVERDLSAKETEVAAQRQRVGITVRHSSLLEFVRHRLEGKYYEDKLGLLHQVQGDLNELTTALLPARARRGTIDPEHATSLEKLFPRGDPRVVLIIDDLDRCPPDQVVEVLEAAQLLVKTPLFVVILALDVRYITRALEKRYDGVLVRGGEPSGLDYIEKIIQIPYRVRAVSAPSVGGFLSSQMHLQTTAQQPTSRVTGGDAEPPPEGDSAAPPENAEHGKGEQSAVTPARPVRSELRMLPTAVLRFTADDHRVISLCCNTVEVSPRAMKRLVNVYTLLKIIWFRHGLKQGPAESVKRVMLALLVLAARYPEVVRQLLRHVEQVYRTGGIEVDHEIAATLATVCRQAERSAAYPPDWRRVEKSLLDEKLVPQDLTFRGLEETNFQLVNSFCFVSETDPAREAALLRGARQGPAPADRTRRDRRSAPRPGKGAGERPLR